MSVVNAFRTTNIKALKKADDVLVSKPCRWCSIADDVLNLRKLALESFPEFGAFEAQQSNSLHI